MTTTVIHGTPRREARDLMRRGLTRIAGIAAVLLVLALIDHCAGVGSGAGHRIGAPHGATHQVA
jgi:hypothetical protein